MVWLRPLFPRWHWPGARLAMPLLVWGLWLSPAHAQQLDPRSYSNIPTGLDFLLAAYAHQEGDVLLDPSVPIMDLGAKIETAAVSYVHTYTFQGQSATVGFIVPYASISANGLVEGQSRSVTRTGFADPTLRLTFNLLGAPALSVKEFGGYRQDLIVGATILVTAPWGHYDPERLINAGTNRWSFKPEIGKTLFQDVHRLVTTNISFIVLVVLLAISGSLALSTRITRPFEKIIVGINAFARGNLDHRIEVKGGREAKGLADVFNAMAEQLKQSRSPNSCSTTS